MTLPTWKINFAKRFNRALDKFRVQPPMRMSEWAAENFYLSRESSYTSGQWRAWPFQIGILDFFGNDQIEFVFVKKSARVGYSKMMLCASAFFTIFQHRNQAIYHSTDSDALEWSQTEYDTMTRDIAAFRPVFPALGKKHQHNTTSFKRFSGVGCVTYIRGGNSSRAYRRISVDAVFLDEISSFQQDIENEGTPLKLAAKRTEGAVFRKIIAGSTPRSKYLCAIDQAVSECGSVFKYHIPCVHCDEFQPLEFGGKTSVYGLKWIDKNPASVAYCCKHCSGLFTQSDYLKIWHLGRWVDSAGNWYDQTDGTFRDPAGEKIQPPKTLGIDNLWSIYSPQLSWSDIVTAWLQAVARAKSGQRNDLKAFVNTTLGQVYSDDIEETSAELLRNRAENYPLQLVPLGCTVLMMGIDCQKDRFELVVLGFGRGEETWIIDYQVVPANLAIADEWNRLDDFLLWRYRHESGVLLSITAAAIDSGGHWTSLCYNFARKRRSASGYSKPTNYIPKLYVTKGSSNSGMPISGKGKLLDFTHNEKLIRNGIKLHIMGSDSAKDLLHARLQVTGHGPGFVHMSNQLPDVFFQHLAAEVRTVKQTPRGAVSVWVKKPSARNEALDCIVMCLFCAHAQALHRKTNAEWDAVESIVQPHQSSLFALPDGHSESQPVEVINHSAGINLSGWGRS